MTALMPYVFTTICLILAATLFHYILLKAKLKQKLRVEKYEKEILLRKLYTEISQIDNYISHCVVNGKRYLSRQREDVLANRTYLIKKLIKDED